MAIGYDQFDIQLGVVDRPHLFLRQDLGRPSGERHFTRHVRSCTEPGSLPVAQHLAALDALTC